MLTLFTILALIVRVYMFILIARILIEMIQGFSRNFQAPRWFNVIGEMIFQVTDPPVKALRRLIPPLRLGGVALDVSILVLYFGLYFVLILLGIAANSFV